MRRRVKKEKKVIFGCRSCLKIVACLKLPVNSRLSICLPRLPFQSRSESLWLSSIVVNRNTLNTMTWTRLLSSGFRCNNGFLRVLIFAGSGKLVLSIVIWGFPCQCGCSSQVLVDPWRLVVSQPPLELFPSFHFIKLKVSGKFSTPASRRSVMRFVWPQWSLPFWICEAIYPRHTALYP